MRTRVLLILGLVATVSISVGLFWHAQPSPGPTIRKPSQNQAEHPAIIVPSSPFANILDVDSSESADPFEEEEVALLEESSDAIAEETIEESSNEEEHVSESSFELEMPSDDDEDQVLEMPKESSTPSEDRPVTLGRTKELVHVVLSGDKHHSVGLLAAAKSVVENCVDVDRLRLLIVTDPESEATLIEKFACVFGERQKSLYSIHPFDKSAVKAPITFSGAHSVYGNLGSHLNFARFYLAQMFPAVDKAVYLDADVICRKDIVDLYSSVLPAGSTAPVAAVFKTGKTVDDYVNFRHPDVRKRCSQSDPSFNAGVLVMNLKEWRRGDYTAVVERFMRIRAEATTLRPFTLMTNPLLVLAVCGKAEKIDAVWNVDGLGHLSSFKLKDKHALLHWNGVHKPWNADGFHKCAALLATLS